MNASAFAKRVWCRRDRLGPLVFLILLVAFLAEKLWLDSAIVGVALVVTLAVFRGLDRRYSVDSIIERIEKGEIPEDGE